MRAPVTEAAGGETTPTLRLPADNFAAWREVMSPCFSLSLLQAEDFGRRAARMTAESATGDKNERRLIAACLVNALPPVETALDHALSLSVRLAFCRSFLENTPMPLTEKSAIPVVNQEAIKIAMPDNLLFAAAAKRFGEAVGAYTPLTVPSFRNVCEEVDNGNATFGILPLEDEREGRLYHFYALIDQFELNLCHTCDIVRPDDAQTVRFALLGRRGLPFGDVAGENMLECSLFESNEQALSDLLSVAADCGLSLRRVDSLPATHGENEFFYRTVFRTNAGNATLFELYLECFVPRATVTGRYLHLPCEDREEKDV